MDSGVGVIVMARKKKPQILSAYQRLKEVRKRHKRIRTGKIVSFLVLCVGVILTSVVLYSTKDAIMTGGLKVVPSAEKSLPPLVYDNPLEQQAVTELRAFGEWLRANEAAGFIGELGWPDRGGESAAWNKVAERWYQEANHHDLWVTAWAAGSWWGDYPMAIYVHKDGERDLDTARAQALVIEKFPTKSSQLRGVNLAGMEFSTEEGFSTANLGTPGTSYFYEPATSMKYLADRGVKLVRLPIRWERIQPTLGGELRASEMQAITAIMDAAKDSGIKVVLDLHNYGLYKAGNGTLTLSTTLQHNQLLDVWKRLSAMYKNHPALGGYGIMNEPHDLPAGNYGSPAKNWEQASQIVINGLRDSGDKNLVLVAGYDWSSLERWAKNHPKGWISDPAKNFKYEAHHYWDKDGSGAYVQSFQQELGNY